MPQANDILYAKNQDFWQNYSRGRPQVPQSFWDRIFQYHASHGGSFGTVHDMGAGGGTHSAKLADRFDHVIVSDVAASNIDIARKELAFNTAATFAFRPGCRVEDSMEPGSVDMIFAANVFHFVDLDAALQAITEQLKPGSGTLVISAFGKHLIYDAEVSACWQKFWERGTTMVIEKSDAKRDEGPLRTFRRLESAYSWVPLDGASFKHRQRIFGNMPESGMRMVAEEFDGQCALPSGIGPQDEIINEIDRDWEFEWDIDDFRASFESFAFMTQMQECCEDLWQEMDRLLTNGRKVKGSWTVWHILAMRR